MNDMAEAPRLFARAGELVTCVRGHPVCSISRDVMVGETRSDIFTDWQQPPPDKATTIARIRCQCRGVWIRGSKGRYQLHFAEGWR